MSGLQNIVEAQGFGIAITGMSIVFTALLLITGCISLLPKLLIPLEKLFPIEDHHTAAGGSKSGNAVDEAEVAAAALAVHCHRASN